MGKGKSKKYSMVELCKSVGLKIVKVKFEPGTFLGGPKPNRLMNNLHDILELSTELKHVKVDELEFLFKLDKKLHYIKQIQRPTLCGCSKSSLNLAENPYMDCHEYTDKKMILREYKKFAEIVERGISNRELILYPASKNWGFSVGFNLDAVTGNLYPGITLKRKGLIAFLKKQLPDGYGFEELSRLFKNQNNEEIVKLCGLPEIRDRKYYDY